MRLISRGEEAVISRSALCQLSRKWASYFGSTFGLDSLDTLDLQSLDQECYFYSYFYFVKRLVDNCECDLSTFSCRIINIEGCDRGRAVWGGTLRLRLGAVLHQLSSLVLVLGRGGHRGLRHGDPVPQRLPPPRPGPAVPRHPPRMQGGLPKVSLPNFPRLLLYFVSLQTNLDDPRAAGRRPGARGAHLQPRVRAGGPRGPRPESWVRPQPITAELISTLLQADNWDNFAISINTFTDQLLRNLD